MVGAIGIDVGSTTAKVVAVDASGRPVTSRSERHRGRPQAVARELFESVQAAHAPVGITGSLGVAFAEEFGAVPVHEVHAVAIAVRELQPATRTIIDLGGQDAKLLFLGNRTADDHAEMNDRCAAGTGATIDRIALRLGLSPRDLACVVPSGSLRVAAKCGVFAETDVVNLVKRGASRQGAFAAVLRAIVIQNLAVLARGRLVRPPVLLLGGPHAHVPGLAVAWRAELAELWAAREVTPGPVIVPEGAETFGAIGAALHALRDARPLATIVGTLEGERTMGPLLRDASDRDRLAALCAAPDPFRLGPGPIAVHLGVDAGSTTSKAIAIDERGVPVVAAYDTSCGDPVADAARRLEELHGLAVEAGAQLDVRSCGVTGYGAALVGPALGADICPVETLAHTTAALAVMPDAELVVDVGGTDVKVIQLEDGRVSGFLAGNQCSAGHGALLATSATDMGVPMELFAERAFAARRMPRFTVGCAVFVDTDRVTFQRRGFDVDEILAGLAWALARNVWEVVVPEPAARLGRRIILTGGTQLNRAAAFAQVRYLEDRVPDATVRIHPRPELCGALGAALTARDHVAQEGGVTGFIGFDAARDVRATARTGDETRCPRCDLGCSRSILELSAGSRARRTLVVGNTCERGADVGSTGQRSRSHAPDLFEEEAARLFRPLSPLPASRPGLPTFGVPRVMALYRSAPLILGYLRAAGVPEAKIVLSPPTSPELFQKGARWGVTDPCFPAKLVLSHVDWLLRHHRDRPIDVLLMPTITHASIAVRGTADTASCPLVAASGHTSLAALRREGDLLARLGVRPLTPELCLVDRARLEQQLLAAFGDLLDLDAEANRAALAAGLRAQAEFHLRCRRRGARVIADAERTGSVAAVILARPYHADPGVSHGVSTELAARGIPVMGIASLPIDAVDDLDISDVLPLATNSGCAEKVWAARVVARHSNLVAVDLSSFRCGQDASILGIMADVHRSADKPTLRLHDIDEDRPGASFALRLDTFAELVRRHRTRVLPRPGCAPTSLQPFPLEVT